MYSAVFCWERSSRFAATGLLALLSLWATDVYAQTGATNQTLSPGAVARDVSYPIVDPARALSGQALVEALRQGGFVLFLRHAQAGLLLPSCPNESTLTPQGEEQAAAVGAALRQLKVPVATVRVSETCRSRDTGRLLDMGPVTVDPRLNPSWMRKAAVEFADRFVYLLDTPPSGANIVAVSHVQPGKEVEDSIQIDLAEVVVYQADGRGRAHARARIRLQDWASLIAPVPAPGRN